MILHVIHDRDRQACGTTLALIAQAVRDTPGPHLLLVLGGSALAHAARNAGIPAVERVGVPFGHPLLAPTAVHRLMHPRPEPEEVHCWSVKALSTAAVFRPGTPRVFHLTQQPDAVMCRRLQRLMLHAGYDAYALTDRQRRALVDAELPAGRVYVDDVELDVDAIASSGRSAGQRNAYGSSDDADFTVALLSEPAWSAATYPPAIAASIMQEVTGVETRLVVHPKQAGRADMQAMLDSVGRPSLLIQEERLDRPWEVLASADAVLLDAGAGPLAVRTALHAGVPIIAPDVPALRELLGDAEQSAEHRITWAVDTRARNLAHAMTTVAREHVEAVAV